MGSSPQFLLSVHSELVDNLGTVRLNSLSVKFAERFDTADTKEAKALLATLFQPQKLQAYMRLSAGS